LKWEIWAKGRAFYGSVGWESLAAHLQGQSFIPEFDGVPAGETRITVIDGAHTYFDLSPANWRADQ